MKSFNEINKERNLIEYLVSEYGTMYFEPNLPREKKVIIRHLDNKLTIDLLPEYVELYNAIKMWLNKYKQIEEYVFLPDLIEVGKDYIVRPFYVFDIAIRDYLDKEDEDYVEPPKLFNEMTDVVSKQLNNSSENGDVITSILRKSLLEPTSKTYFNHQMNKFIIVEPKISLDNIKQWKVNKTVS